MHVPPFQQISHWSLQLHNSDTGQIVWGIGHNNRGTNPVDEVLFPLATQSIKGSIANITTHIAASFFGQAGIENLGGIYIRGNATLKLNLGAVGRNLVSDGSDYKVFAPFHMVGSGRHRWGLLGKYPAFIMVMVIYHYVEKIWWILVTPDFFVWHIWSWTFLFR